MILKKIYYLILKERYKKKKIYLRKNVSFEKTIFEGCGKFGKDSNINSSFIGYGTYIGKKCNLPFVKIGRFCSIGNNVVIIAGDHPIYDYVSSHPIFYTDALKKQGLYFKNYVKRNVEKYLKNENFSVDIGNDVWIGTNVSILGGGVKIGDGAVIGAGAVVTKDVAPYSVVAGVPAKEIRKRFTDEEILFLEKFKWWDKDIKWLDENVVLFSDIKLFIKKMKENL